MTAIVQSSRASTPKPLVVAAGIALFSVIACAAPAAPGKAATSAEGDIEWTVSQRGPNAGAPTLRLRERKSTSDMRLDGRRAEFSGARAALGGSAGPVAFRVTHDAGQLTCRGTLTAAFAGAGRCSFIPDADFSRALEQRGLGTPTRRDQMAMLMVNANLALADGLIKEGLKPRDNGELIAAAALNVTPAYVRELRSGALKIDSIDTAIACKALSVDGAYVRGLASAGYTNLTSDQVVSMKALGVTPDYARSINAAAGRAK